MENIKEITMDELKGLLGDSIKELMPTLKSEIVGELKGDMKNVITKDTDEEVVEKAAGFIKDLCNGVLEKSVDSSTASFGYTVPTQLASFILVIKDKIAKMRKLAFVFQMAGNFQLPTQGTGVTAYWVAENDEIDESNPTVGKLTLSDYYLAARVLMPRQLLNTSAMNIMNYVGELCARSLRAAEETAFIAGDGNGKPTGLRLANIAHIDMVGSAIAYGDIVNLFYELPEQYRENAVFITSSAGVKLIRTLVDLNRLPIFDMRDQKIFQKSLIETVDIPANLGSGTDTTEIYFGDMWYYWIKDGETMFVDTQKVLKNLQIELVVAEAVDGVYTLPDACRKLVGVK